MSDPRPVLVLGGTGTTGRRVAARLLAHGVPVRIGSRHGRPPFEWNEPPTWRAVAAGARAAYVVYLPDLAFPGALDAVTGFADVATAAGVERLVLLSGRGEPAALAAERALAAVAERSGASWTVVRASWFTQNFSESFLRPLVLEGVIALPAADVPEPFVDADDIADVVVAALTGGGHDRRTYEVTGPEALTFSDVAAVLTGVLGRAVRYTPVTAEQFVGAAAGAGMAAPEAAAIADLFTSLLDGRNAQPTGGVAEAIGRAPRSFVDVVRSAAAAGAWDAAVPA